MTALCCLCWSLSQHAHSWCRKPQGLCGDYALWSLSEFSLSSAAVWVLCVELCFQFFPFSVTVATGLLWTSFSMLRCSSLISIFLNHKGMLFFAESLLHLFWWHVTSALRSIYVLPCMGFICRTFFTDEANLIMSTIFLMCWWIGFVLFYWECEFAYRFLSFFSSVLLLPGWVYR